MRGAFPPPRVPIGILLFCAMLAAAPAAALEVTLSLGTLRHELFQADGVTVSFDAARRGEADVRLARLRFAGNEYQDLQAHCSGFFFDGRRLDCPVGTVRRDDARGKDRPALPFSFSYRAADGRIELALPDIDAVALSPLVKRLRAWRPAGKLDLRLLAEKGEVRLNVAARGLEFASREGDVAGKGIVFTLAARAQRQGGGWRWRADLHWPEGEFFRAPWRPRAGLRAEAEGRLSEAWLEVDLARIELAGLGEVTAGLRWDRHQGEATDWGFVTESIDIAAALRDWVQPWLSRLGAPELRAAGRARFSAEAKAGELRRFYAGLEDATLSDRAGHLEFSGVNARLPWERGGTGEGEVSVANGRLGDLPLGGFALPVRLSGDEASITGLTVPLLDGRLVIDAMRVARRGARWQGEFEGGIEGVSMEKVSRTLRLPAMAGNLTARVPRIAYADGTLHLDGALGIEVFDGGLIVHQLRVSDPFGPRRRFVADVTARNLDLGMLTRTFAFGSIEGRFDADLHDLEMEGWKPVRFQARIASSPGDYPRLVSLGALQDIADMGEDGAGATVRRMPARTLGAFGYARIAFGCTLREGVCLLDGGGAGKDGGVVIMEGSGLPSVSIIGYNRRIDWEALVARIREKLAGRAGVVIE